MSDFLHYPFLTLSKESSIPRLLVTRDPEEVAAAGGELFGPFLSEKAVPYLITFILKQFGVRSCKTFPQAPCVTPCTQFRKKLCSAPCVPSLCSAKEYSKKIEALKVFLSGDKERIEDFYNASIAEASEALEYERAAQLEKQLKVLLSYISKGRNANHARFVTDSWYIEPEAFTIVSQRRTRALGVRRLTKSRASLIEELSEALGAFYAYHTPKMIRLVHASSLKKELAVSGSLKKIMQFVSAENVPVTTTRILKKSALSSFQVKQGLPNLSQRIQSDFALRKKPIFVDAFDVAHISGKAAVATVIRYCCSEREIVMSESWFYPECTELEALRRSVCRAYQKELKTDQSVFALIDGGKAQLQVVLREIGESGEKMLCAATKPPKEHSQVSHFLIGEHRFEFSAKSELHLLLQALRDEVHRQTNALHRLYRDGLSLNPNGNGVKRIKLCFGESDLAPRDSFAITVHKNLQNRLDFDI